MVRDPATAWMVLHLPTCGRALTGASRRWKLARGYSVSDARPDRFLEQAWRARRLFAAVPLFAFGTGALYPLIALELSASGASTALIGAVTSAWYLGTFLGAALSGPWISRLGYRVSFAAAAILAAASVWGLNLSGSLYLWLFLRFVGGFGLGAYYLLIESWISSAARETTRGRMLASYEVIRISAVALGPLLLLIGATHTAFAMIGVAFLTAILPVAGARPPQVTFDDVRWRGALKIFACSPCSVGLMVVAGFLSSSFYGFGALYAEDLLFSRAEVAFFVSVTLFAPALIQLPVGSLADFCGRAEVAALVSAVAGAAALLLAAGPAATFLPVVLLAASVIGLGSPLYALGYGRLIDGGHDLITATAAGLVGYNLGTFAGPLGAALAMERLGPAGLFLWIGACLLCATVAAVAAIRLPQRHCCPL